jgi:prophage regulatory protein
VAKTDRVFRPAEAATKLGVGRSTLYRLIKLQLLPRPIKTGVRASGWLESTLDEYLARRQVSAT